MNETMMNKLYTVIEIFKTKGHIPEKIYNYMTTEESLEYNKHISIIMEKFEDIESKLEYLDDKSIDSYIEILADGIKYANKMCAKYQ